jgi:transcriptional regulator of arginine metabolism
VKSLRQAKIREIIKSKPVNTQEQLAEELASIGIEVTQATVSRDIKEMGLIKIPTTSGEYRYALPPRALHGDPMDRARRVFADSVLSVDYSENLVLIRTLPGNAGAVGDVVDDLNWPGIVGTLAGDDTVLVIVRPKELAMELLEDFDELRG